MQLFAAPVHFQREDSSWVDVDPTLVSVDGVLRPEALPGEVRLSAAGGETPLMTLGDENAQVRMFLPGAALVDPVAEGPLATYLEVFPGSDFQVMVGSRTVKQMMVWSVRPEVAVVELALSVDEGIEPSLTDLGGVTFADSRGVQVGAIAPPLVWDSNVNLESAEPVYGPVA